MLRSKGRPTMKHALLASTFGGLALVFQVCAIAALAEEQPIDPVAKCSREMSQRPQFSEIATKLPLMDIRQISFAMIADQSFPTDKQRKAISAWFDEHEACRKAGDEYRRTQYPPDIYSLLQEGETGMRIIGADLYNKKITYGEANKRLQQLADDVLGRLTRIVKQYQAAIAAQKAAAEEQAQQQQALADARQAQEQALRQQRAMLFLNFMRANQPPPIQFHPMPVSPTVTTNCSAFGNQWSCQSR